MNDTSHLRAYKLSVFRREQNDEVVFVVVRGTRTAAFVLEFILRSHGIALTEPLYPRVNAIEPKTACVFGQEKGFAVRVYCKAKQRPLVSGAIDWFAEEKDSQTDFGLTETKK